MNIAKFYLKMLKIRQWKFFRLGYKDSEQKNSASGYLIPILTERLFQPHFLSFSYFIEFYTTFSVCFLQEQGAKFVIAVTHMRWPNDIRLAELVPDVDLILGGHDHGYGVKDVDGEERKSN